MFVRGLLLLVCWLPCCLFCCFLKNTHQCDFHNFGGAFCSNCTTSIHTSSIQLGLPHPTHCKNVKGEFPQSLASPCHTPLSQSILAEGAIALSVTLSGGALFAAVCFDCAFLVFLELCSSTAQATSWRDLNEIPLLCDIFVIVHFQCLCIYILTDTIYVYTYMWYQNIFLSHLCDYVYVKSHMDIYVPRAKKMLACSLRSLLVRQRPLPASVASK